MSNPTSILVIGKRGGVLQWFEHVLDSQLYLPDVKISSFALNHNNQYERLHKRILKTMQANEQLENLTATLLAQKIKLCQPQIILITDLYYLTDQIKEVLNQVKNKTTIFHWIGDFFDQRLKSNQSVIDHFLFTDSTFIADAENLGLQTNHYFPLAANQRLFYPPSESSLRKNQLIFIGAWSENRESLFKDFSTPLSLYGKGWDKLNSDKIETHAKNIHITKVADLYREHQFVLNVINRKNIREGLNMRCFEAPACGALLITEYTADLDKCFTIDEDVLAFDAQLPISSQIDTMLSKISPDKLQRRANRAREKVVLEHTYSKRMEQIIKIAKNS